MTTHFLQRPDGQIAYDETGSGPLVICSPSMGDLRGEYRFLAPLLAQAGYRVVSMDVRGHGESSTGWGDVSVGAVGSDMLALIRSLESGPAVIIGTSMSAGAAVWAAAEAPELVRGIVLIGPFVRGTKTFASEVTRVLFALMFMRPWGPGLWMTYFNTLFPTAKPADFEDYTARLRANLLQPGRMEALNGMMAASKIESEKRLPLVTAPALVLMGSKDPDFANHQEDEARWVAAQVHGAYRMIAGAGHYPHAEMPEVTAAEILAFLQSLPQPEELTVAA